MSTENDRPEWPWEYSKAYGVRTWVFSPLAGTNYLVCALAGEIQANISTGTSYKFIRPIPGEFSSVRAALLGCESHWKSALDGATEVGAASAPSDQSPGRTTSAPTASPACEWEDDEGKCPHAAIYRTHWYKMICRGHGSILMVNHGLDYLVDLPQVEEKK